MGAGNSSEYCHSVKYPLASLRVLRRVSLVIGLPPHCLAPAGCFSSSEAYTLTCPAKEAQPVATVLLHIGPDRVKPCSKLFSK